MPRINLTNAFLSSVTSVERLDYYDTTTEGLIFRVSNNSKTFSYRYRASGGNGSKSKIKRYTIGKWPDVSLSDARKIAKQLKGKIALNEDPQQEKIALIQQNIVENEKLFTFNDLAELFKKRHLPTLRDKTRIEYNRIIDNELIPLFGKYPVNEIRRRKVVDLMDSIAEDRNAPTFANRVKAVISKMYNFAIEREYAELNPAFGVSLKAKGKVKRKRVYSDSEIKLLWNAFDIQAEPIRTYFKLLLVLGQRKTETVTMRWDQIDFTKRLWTIPQERTKADREHIVPLSSLAIDLLIELRSLTGNSDFVFKSDRKDAPIKWLDKATSRIRELKDAVNDFRIHDLRRTCASNMAKLHTDRTVLGKILNHKGLAGDDQVTAIYDRHEYIPEMHEALERWSIQLKHIITGEREPARITKIA
jgi:integrase